MSQAVRGPWFALLGFLTFLGLMAGGGATALAQDVNDLFTVSGVAVDVSAANATAAREQALAEGQAAALTTLLQRLTRREDWRRLPTASGDALAFLVTDFEVDNERTSAVRYLASLTVRFKPSEVRGLLRQASIPFAETPSRPVLVLPVLRQGLGVVLWDDPNQWRTAWAAMGARRSSLVPMLIPFGDLSDIADVSAEQAVAGETEPLATIARRYGARDSLVAIATVETAFGNPTRLDVAVTRIGATQQAPILLDVAARPGEDERTLLRRGAAETADAVEDAWVEANLLRFDQAQQLALRVPVTSLAEWLDVRQRLQRVAVVTDLQLRSLSRESALVDLTYFGELGQLQDALVQRDLVLEPTSGLNTDGLGGVLRLAGAP